jgi:polysaccharide biosynthesis protein PelA
MFKLKAFCFKKEVMRWIILFLLLHSPFFAGEELSRRIVAFWDSKTDNSLDFALSRVLYEMPLNYLGLDVEFYDIQKPLPNLSQRKDVRGVLISLNPVAAMSHPVEFIDWAISALDQGKKIVIMGNPGFLISDKGLYTSSEEVNRLYERIGLTTTLQAVDYPYHYQIIDADSQLLSFEKTYPKTLPSFYTNTVNTQLAKSYLRVGIPEKRENSSDLIVISRFGGFVAENYDTNYEPLISVENPRALGWYINPFLFFGKIFDLATLPVPDTTTLAGRRLFFSYCDGDSWNIKAEIEKYKKEDLSCAAVLLEEVIKPNPDIPITVGIVAADLDPQWAGSSSSQKVAREYFAMPQVETASHTYSHPFDWKFFEHHGKEKEIYYLHLYPYGSWQNSFLSWFRAKWYQRVKPDEFAKLKLKWGYIIPRAYANKPFDLDREIQGAAIYLDQFAPPNKKIGILLWSGDGLPWGNAVQLCYEHHLKNLGVGFNRFDSEYPSILYLSPLSRKPGGWIQTLGAANAENSYTKEWSERFFGFRYLPETLKNTGFPRRLKPIALYYHSYSGQFAESVQAVLDNIEYIRKQKPVPIRTSRYVDIVDGFFSIVMERLGDARWKIKNRKGLQTIRFDEAGNMVVDFLNSKGVVGFNHFGQSLYVYLDAAEPEPILQISHGRTVYQSYLMESSWEVWNVRQNEKMMAYLTRGWGKHFAQWHVPSDGDYQVTAHFEGKKFSQVVASSNRRLSFEIDLPYESKVEIRLARVGK